MLIFIARQGHNLGPFDLATVNTKLASGEFSPADLAWCEGAPGWLPLHTFEGVVVPDPSQVPPTPPQNPQPPSGVPTQSYPQQGAQPQGGYPTQNYPQPGGCPQNCFPQPYPAPVNTIEGGFEVERVLFDVSASPIPAVLGGCLTCGLLLLTGLPAALSSRYRLTTQRLTASSGLLSKRVEELEVYRVRDVTFSQGAVGRMLGFGDVVVHSNDASSPRLLLRNVPGPERIKEQIRTAARQGRKSEGVRSMEYMG